SRGDDLSRLRQRVIHYINPPRRTKLKGLRIKSNRGFRNILTGRLLCPVGMLEQFDDDPTAFLVGVRDGKIHITSRDWPLFIYKESAMQPGKLRPGLFRSELLEACYKAVYTGPQSADDELKGSCKSTGKPSISQKYGMQVVSAETLCYVIALASWSVKDGHYNGQEFMYSLLCAFAQDTAWSDKVLDWWTRYVLTRPIDLLTNETP
ncbi:uncharacterized protein TRAVEDRAFT_109399, partial [Trametes versicolor FP-101664 SS1]|uniref:uncharacterized protein n=1 Tax=Trametes versicolor (strain FP-101664) TaxID=717944 RepID=UPI00046225A4